jgi:predicted dehydrogenase
MKIGLIGSDSFSSHEFVRLLNIDKISGVDRVAFLWGEKKAQVKKLAKLGKIPVIVNKAEEMIGMVDAVIIAHENPVLHAKAALPFVDAGTPVFIDKAFSTSLPEAKNVLQTAKKKGCPVTSFSMIAEQKSFKENLLSEIASFGKITSISISGKCDVTSKSGGVFYEGIHIIEVVLKAFGTGIKSAQAFRAGRVNRDTVSVLQYTGEGPVVSATFVSKGDAEISILAFGEKESVNYINKNDPDPYFNGFKKIMEMFRYGIEPYSHKQILESVAVLEAIERSIKNGKPARVEKI